MNRILKVLLSTGLLLFLLGSVAMAAASQNLAAALTGSGMTTLQWTFQAGDVAEYSLDGITWTQIGDSGAASGPKLQTGGVFTGNDVVVGLTDYTNYYFRVRAADGTYSNVADAFPPNEHAHRYFATDTNRCASCHATHTALGAKLLKAATVDAMCKTCHASGNGAKYQVDDGTVKVSGGTIPALAGFFGSIGRPVGSSPTSRHDLDVLLTEAPGGDPSNANGKWNEALGCGSCHSAHGSKAYQYRLLSKSLPNKMAGTGGAGTAAITNADLIIEAYAVTTADKETAYYKTATINNFCGGCHADYNTGKVVDDATGGGAGAQHSGVFNQSYYRHAVNKKIEEQPSYPGSASTLTSTLPLTPTVAPYISNGTSHDKGLVNCITCHFPHGTAATATDGQSKLLRLNNRGVCQDCHKKS